MRCLPCYISILTSAVDQNEKKVMDNKKQVNTDFSTWFFSIFYTFLFSRRRDKVHI